MELKKITRLRQTQPKMTSQIQEEEKLTEVKDMPSLSRPAGLPYSKEEEKLTEVKDMPGLSRPAGLS